MLPIAAFIFALLGLLAMAMSKGVLFSENGLLLILLAGLAVLAVLMVSWLARRRAAPLNSTAIKSGAVVLFLVLLTGLIPEMIKDAAEAGGATEQVHEQKPPPTTEAAGVQASPGESPSAAALEAETSSPAVEKEAEATTTWALATAAMAHSWMASSIAALFMGSALWLITVYAVRNQDVFYFTVRPHEARTQRRALVTGLSSVKPLPLKDIGAAAGAGSVPLDTAKDFGRFFVLLHILAGEVKNAAQKPRTLNEDGTAVDTFHRIFDAKAGQADPPGSLLDLMIEKESATRDRLASVAREMQCRAEARRSPDTAVTVAELFKNKQAPRLKDEFHRLQVLEIALKAIEGHAWRQSLRAIHHLEGFKARPKDDPFVIALLPSQSPREPFDRDSRHQAEAFIEFLLLCHGSGDVPWRLFSGSNQSASDLAPIAMPEHPLTLDEAHAFAMNGGLPGKSRALARPFDQVTIRGLNYEDIKSLEAGLKRVLDRLGTKGAPPDIAPFRSCEITVDITPGTKPLSVAAALHTLRRDYTILYTNNGGTPTVFDGALSLMKTSL